MIIEFSGPSGAGKTTCIRQLIVELEQRGIPNGCVHSAALNNCPAIPAGLSEVEGQNWKTDLRMLPWAIALFLRHPALAAFIVTRLWQLPEDPREKLAIFRSIIRKAGIRTYLDRRRFRDFAVVVDEGLVHVAHNLLMSAHSVATRDDVHRFMALLPSPDLLMIVTAEPQVLVERLMRRGDLSPRIKAPGQLESFVRNAWGLFELMAAAPASQPMQLWRSDIQDVGQAVSQLVDDIASSLAGPPNRLRLPPRKLY